MASEASDAEIAELCALNSLTVRVHMSNTLIKLGCATCQGPGNLALDVMATIRAFR